MKRSYSIFALAAFIVTALCFSSCEGVPAQGDGDQQVTVVGTWKCESADYGSLPEDAAVMIQQGDRMTLKEDNTYYLDAREVKQKGTWSIDSRKEKLKIVSPDMTLNFNITQLTASRMSCYLYVSGHTLKYTFIRI